MRVALVHLAIAAWLVAGSRVLTGVVPNGAGALDDAGVVLLYGALQLGATRIRDGLLRGVLSWTLAIGLVAAVFTNQVFFSYFNTYLGIASIRLAGIATDASSSITELIGLWNGLALLVAPLAAHALAARRLSRSPAPRGDAAWGLFFTGLLLTGAGSLLRGDVFLFAENNPTAALVREAATRIAGAVSPDDASDAVYPDDVPALLSRHAWAGYEAAGGPSHPTWQRPLPGREGRSAEPPPNVVLVLMESMRGLEMRGPFRALPVTPQLGSLEARALVFPNFYANGVTTVDAEFSVLCSALPVVGRAPVYIRKPELRIRCLPEILREHGYETHWISAYRADYANKRRFLEAHGVETIHDQASFDLSRAMNPPVGWGMGDVDMFEQALEKMDGFDEPFFAEVMTLSNHHPFDHDYGLDFPDFTRVPGEAHYHDYLRGMHYTDHAVGSFVRAALQRPWGQRTVFVILGDHGVRSFPTTENGERAGPVLETEIFFRNRLILLAPGRVEPGVSPLVGSQIDLAPTLLDVLGIRSENGFLGVSLLAPLDAERRHAWMNVGHAFNFRSGNRYCFSVGYSCFERAFPRCEEGVEPTAIGHTCFELEGDLFDAGAARAVRVLEAQEGAATLERAEHLSRLNRRLIARDAFRP